MRPALLALVTLTLLAASGCAQPRAHPKAAPVAPTSAAEAPAELPEVAYAPAWQKTSFGWYLAPQRDPARDGGAIDLVVHFHFGREADESWRSSRLDAVIASATFGMGSNAYEHAMRDPARFERMIDEVMRTLADERKTGPLKVRHLGVVSFSAGFGAVRRVLATSTYFDRIDALVLLDSIHTAYTHGRKPDPRGITDYIRFAEEAKEGRKLMVITHSAIPPPDYAGTTETTAALLDAVGIPKTDAVETNARGMHQLYRAEAGAFHAFGFDGDAAKDHMDHLAMVGDIVREYVARRWASR